MLLLLTATLASAQPQADAFAQARALGRGVNLLGYDRVWQSREQGRFQPKHFRLIKEAGFTTVRINLFPFRHMTETNGWALKPEWLGTLDWIVALAREQNLKVILDLHEFTVIGEDPAAHKPKFLAFWRQISAHGQKLPPDVVFEVLNEPSGKLTEALWNEYFAEALALIREKNPTRLVVVGPGHWNSFEHLGELVLPEKDRNLLVTIHYYQPFEFTHQGAAWAGRADKVGVDWAGTAAERAAIKRDFDVAAAWAKKNNRPMLLGEFGAYEKADLAARARYVDAVARAAEAQGWSWAYWQFDRDFFVFDTARDRWVEPILHGLIPPAAKRDGAAP